MSSRRRGWRARLWLVVLGTVGSALLIELTVRLVTHAPLFVLGGPQGERYVEIDPVGRLPRSNISVRLPKGFTVTTGDHGTRSNGQPPPAAERPLMLATGDSFAFGDEVDDPDAWPAVLERLSGQRVINGGVPGFGLDQAVLRAEHLADVYRPDTVIVGFIPHDVLRCALSYWSGNPKPYFDIVDGTLRLRPAPAPEPTALDPLKRILSASVALDMLVPTFVHWTGPRERRVHDQAPQVACLLMQRLAALARAGHARVVVLAQPQQADETADDAELVRGVLDCARANQLETLDLLPVVAALPPAQRQALFSGHMTVAGNRLVGEQLAAFLARPAASGN